MAPRNNDGNLGCKKSCPTEVETNPEDVVPCLRHKKHKVVKLVKDQMQKIQNEGFLNPEFGVDIKEEVELLRMVEEPRQNQSRSQEKTCKFMTLIIFLIIIFVLILTMVWISAGPLSNSIAHTPIPMGSFVQTERPCSLEKKYLLRWGKAEYYE